MSALFPDDPCVHCLLCCILDDQDQVQLRRLTLEEFRRYSEQFLAFNQVSTRNMPFFVGPNVMLQVNEKDVTKNGIMSKCLVPHDYQFLFIPLLRFYFGVFDDELPTCLCVPILFWSCKV